MTLIPLFIFLCLFLSIIHLSNNQLCNTIDNCFDCVTDNCKWDETTKCQSTIELYDKVKWYLKYDHCMTDMESIDIMNEYCYFSNPNSLPAFATLLKVNDKYSKKNLFCKWEFNISDSSMPIILNVTKSIESRISEDKYIINYKLADETESTSNFETLSYFLKSSIVKKVTFIYYSPKGPLTKTPFELILDYDQSMSVFDIVIIVVVVVLGVVFAIIIAITIFQCYKYVKMKRKSISENNINNINNNLRSIAISNMHSQQQLVGIPPSTEKKKELKELLKPEPYEKNEKNIGTVCTICFEEFIADASVVTLRCSHLFHYQCMNDYVNKAKGTMKCPNCNIELIESNDNNKNEVVESIPLNRVAIVSVREMGDTNNNNGYRQNNIIDQYSNDNMNLNLNRNNHNNENRSNINNNNMQSIEMALKRNNDIPN